MDDYGRSLRAAAYGLWSGRIDRESFMEMFELAIDRYLRKAWREGLADIGLTPEDMELEEELELTKLVLTQYDYTAGFADFIQSRSKDNDGKLADIQPRLALWANQYNYVKNMAKTTAMANPPLEWSLGGTEEHCADCAYANGRVYRAKTWARWGWSPQSHDLECKGFQCQCGLNAVPKGTRIDRGHPRRPVGGK